MTKYPFCLCTFCTMFLPQFVFAQEKENTWFPSQSKYDYANSCINRKGWLNEPDGKHGFLQMKEEHLIFQDGKR